jgi:predicted ATP-grasp superfamily ATP-dependent carboligase
VLVTGGHHVAALAAVRALRAAGYEPWVSQAGKRSYAARSRATAGTRTLADAGKHPDEFIAGILALHDELGLDFVLPGTERDLIAISRARVQLGTLVSGIPTTEAILKVTTKRSLYELAREVGLRAPPTFEVERIALYEDNGLPLPAIVKPTTSELRVHDRVVRLDAECVHNREELRALAQRLPVARCLVQPLLAGELGAICGVAFNGEIIAAVHQVAKRIWPVDAGISAYAQTVTRNHRLEEAIGALVEKVGWSGIFQAQFIHAAEGPYLIDFNPRIYGSMSLAVAAGVNLPALWIKLVNGAAVPPSPYRVGVRYRADELDPRVLLHLLRGGAIGRASGGLMPRPNTTHSVFSLRDPLPALTSLEKLRHRIKLTLRPVRQPQRRRRAGRAKAW